MIRNQVKLPMSVAFEVVLQGIQIRLGRSLVTVSGVVLGIAFLTSILTTQLIKQGVRVETEARAETQRMYRFLTAEMGPVDGRVLAVMAVGSLADLETRLLTQLVEDGVQEIRWHGDIAAPSGLSVTATELGVLAEGASALLVLGEGALPTTDWAMLLAKARQRVIALGQVRDVSVSDAAVVQLSREPRPDELEAKAKALLLAKTRNLWIVVISLLVTVICISNSMLMAVTERFREIGTMKCLGALSSFIRLVFLIESSLMGLAGGIAGSLVGVLFSLVVYGFSYSPALMWQGLDVLALIGYSLSTIVAGILLSVIAAIYPANFAARMVPAMALRSNI